MRLSSVEANNEALLTVEEEIAAVCAWKNDGDIAARELLVRSHARLAWKIARRYTKDPEQLKDFAQQGMIGLMKAADKYDIEKSNGIRFAGYAVWWIKTSITEKITETTSVVSVPVKVFIQARRSAMSDAPDSPLIYSTRSLDEPLGEDGGATELDMLVCHRPTPAAAAEKASSDGFFRDSVASAMGCLTPREAEIVRRRRLRDAPDTLEDIAGDLGITRERVRQIEVQSVAKMRRALLAADFPVESLIE